MSYLQMASAPLPDTSKMIVSFWFREVSKQQQKPPKITQWPQAFWTDGSDTMVPPNAQYSIGYDSTYNNCVFFWNAYGLPVGGEFFGDLFLGPPACWIPNAPPLVTNTLSFTGDASGIADVAMSNYGIRTLLTFGDPGIPYQYCPWTGRDPGVIDAVQTISVPGIIVEIQPPPYQVYNHFVGDNGKFHVRNYRLGLPAARPDVKVAQSFIGIDDDGHIVINLQTSTRANYTGCSFEMIDISELRASQTHLKIREPLTYTQLGFPLPDGDWISVPGYWNGYEFQYRDISTEIMGCTPESFVITAQSTALFDFAFGAPTIKDGGWHHVLFSFDISGSVHSERPSVADYSSGSPIWSQADPIVSSNCKAWLAVDDTNITGEDLQNRPRVHDGSTLPKLRGTLTTQLLDCGPCMTYSRGGAKGVLGLNGILPRNAWLTGVGNPKDGLLQNAANVGIVDTTSNDPGTKYVSDCAVNNGFGVSNGDFNPMSWTGAIWPLYGGINAVAPGPWFGTCDPKRPTTPDPPSTLAHPVYDCQSFSIPIARHPIGIPASAAQEENNTGVEMAELQIWCNQSIDTGDLRMRRLFINYPKDANGNPDLSQPMIPVPPAEAAKILGRPDILLHGTNNWKAGRNTGTSGLTADGKIIPAGQFQPIAKIEKFLPDPKLGI
jgi:hypothetical protein